MSVLLPALLLGTAVLVVGGPPGSGAVRLEALTRGAGPQRRAPVGGTTGGADPDRAAAPVAGSPTGHATRTATDGGPGRAPAGPYAGQRPVRSPATPGHLRPSSARSRLLAVPVALVAGAAIVLAAGVGVALLLGAAAATGLATVQRRRRATRDERERTRAVEACTALAHELRAGRTQAEALAVAAALAEGGSQAALRAADAAVRLGGDVPALLLQPRATAVPEVLRGLAACWQVCGHAGSGLSAAVDRLADALRARRAQERSVEAALAGAHATAVLLALLPLAGVGLGAALGARPLHVLLHTPLGVACLALGLALEFVGMWWTRRIVAAAVR